MAKKANINIYSTVGIAMAVFVLLVYSFTDAEWTKAPQSPPDNNVDAPINVGSDAQVKTGNIGANIFAANESVWSPKYCDENGENCVPAGADGGLANCILEYRMIVRDNFSAWKSVALDGRSHLGDPSIITREEPCKGTGCGIQMRMSCSKNRTSVLNNHDVITGLVNDATDNELRLDRIYNSPSEREWICNNYLSGSKPKSWSTSYFGAPKDNNIGKYIGGQWIKISPALRDNHWLNSITCTTNPDNVPTTYYDWSVSVPELTATNRTRSVVCTDSDGQTVAESFCEENKQKPWTKFESQ